MKLAEKKEEKNHWIHGKIGKIYSKKKDKNNYPTHGSFVKLAAQNKKNHWFHGKFVIVFFHCNLKLCKL